MVVRRTGFVLALLLSASSFSQTMVLPDSIPADIGVTLSAQVDPPEVPLNRTLVLSVRLSWSGDLDWIEPGEPSDPVLTNFDIVGTASTNRVTDESGGRTAVKEIQYTLRPKTLGMGYVEPLTLTYTDIRTGRTFDLKTRRIEVEVLSGIPEKGKSGLLLLRILGAFALAAAAVGAFLILRRRRAASSRKEPEKPILEEAVLRELKEKIPLKTQDRREAFSLLSKRFRQYLSEKYGIPGLEVTTAGLIQSLKEKGIEEAWVERCEKLFSKADVVKFSGHPAPVSEWEDAYTTVETFLERNLAEERKRRQQSEEEKLRSRSGWLGRIRAKIPGKQ